MRGHLTRKRHRPQLELHREKTRLLQEEKRRRLEQEEEERRRLMEEAEIQRRERVEQLEREKTRRQAALVIWDWYKSRKAIVDAKVQRRFGVFFVIKYQGQLLLPVMGCLDWM